MHVISTGSPRRSRVVRGLTLTASAGLVVAVLPAGTAAAATPETWVVHAGESIQAAVDRAASGDTIEIEAGEYNEAVCIVGKGLTIIGAGRDEGGTHIVWQAENPPAAASTPCWEAENASAPQSDPATLADDLSALFFLDPDGPVSVTGLATANHPANGIAARGADGFKVRKTLGYGHHRYGILAADSTHIRITRNIERGADGGTAGISVADSDLAYAHIASNHVEDYNLGIFAREARSGVIENNYVTENCVGVLVFDDAATEVPDAGRNVEAGDWAVRYNEVSRNNRYCIAGIGDVQESLRVSGVGVSVVNADYVTIEGNTVTGNAPSVADPYADLDFPAGGLTLLTLPPFNNPLGVDPGPVEQVTVVGNSITGNVPVDVLLGSPEVSEFLLEVGAGVELDGNSCRIGVPAEVC